MTLNKQYNNYIISRVTLLPDEDRCIKQDIRNTCRNTRLLKGKHTCKHNLTLIVWTYVDMTRWRKLYTWLNKQDIMFTFDNAISYHYWSSIVGNVSSTV